MRSSGDPKYAHLEQDLHVLIEVEAPPGQAHARLGLAIEEIKKFLVPVSKLCIAIGLFSLDLHVEYETILHHSVQKYTV